MKILAWVQTSIKSQNNLKQLSPYPQLRMLLWLVKTSPSSRKITANSHTICSKCLDGKATSMKRYFIQGKSR